MNYLSKVKKFHKVFGHPVVDKPSIPDLSRCNLRVSLLKEELGELITAISENDLTEVADAFADLQFVLCGAILEFGMASKFDKLFEEVTNSNMSKSCKTIEVAEQTVQKYAESGVETYIQTVKYKGEKFFIIKRNEDDKILKSIEMVQPDLAKIL